MENNLPVISKRVWSIARVLFFMRLKGFTKPKLFTHLNLMIKRPGKLAGKAIANLISHHHHHHSHHGTSAASHDAPLQFCTAREYEFSFSNTPNYSFFSKRQVPRHFLACAHAPLTLDDDAVGFNNALNVAASEMIEYDRKGKAVVEASPARPASRWTRPVRQVRVTDSPYPVQDGDDGDHQVDKAATEFIESFYKELMKQG